MNTFSVLGSCTKKENVEDQVDIGPFVYSFRHFCVPRRSLQY